MEKLLEASDKAATYLASMVGPDGVLSNSTAAPDLASQYKLPTLLLIGGHIDAAQRLLDRIKRDFMQTNGDFLSYQDKVGNDRKTSVFVMSHFWTYMNNWIAMAAQRTGRFDISGPAFAFAKLYYNPILKGVCITEMYEEITDSSTMDCLSTTHFGLLCLYMGDVSTAIDCGETLLTFVAKQPNLDEQLLLRMSAKTGSLISTVPENMEPFYKIKKDAANQLYFFLGYHGIFMTKLYQATNDDRFLDSAKQILEFALECHESMYSFIFSHKLGYAAALVAVETKEPKFKDFGMKIADYLVSIQTDEGLFGESDTVDQFDQSAEIAIWLREIHAEMSKL